MGILDFTIGETRQEENVWLAMAHKTIPKKRDFFSYKATNGTRTRINKNHKK